jgi:hypothetical protein
MWRWALILFQCLENTISARQTEENVSGIYIYRHETDGGGEERKGKREKEERGRMERKEGRVSDCDEGGISH